MEIKLIGYDYTNNLHKDVAVDPTTKALLVKDLTAVTDHGVLTGLNDDDHSQYWNNTRGDAKITTHAGNAAAHHAKYTDAAAVIAAKAESPFAHAGAVSHAGATLKAGTQFEGRVSAYARDAVNNYTAGDKTYGNAPFREKMTNTPTSITLSDAAETYHWRDQNDVAEYITLYAFTFVIESDGTSRAFAVGSKKYVTVGN